MSQQRTKPIGRVGGPTSQRSAERERKLKATLLAQSVAQYHLEEAFWCHHVLDLRRRMRVAVEAMFRHVHWAREGDPEGKDLGAITEALQGRGVRMQIIECANQLRRFGNEASHARDGEPLRQRMEDNEVEEALYRLRDLTKWYFGEFLGGHAIPEAITASLAFFDPKDVVAGRIRDADRFMHDRRLFELRGKYRLDRLEGVGTTAVVYDAFDTLLERRRALKVQKLELKQSEKVLEIIRREAKLLADTTHPRLVAVTAVDRLLDGRIFFEMPFLPGGSAATHVSRGGIETLLATAWAADLLEALAFLHERGLVHRDVKPENLLIDGEGRAQLADFGLARTLDGNEFIRTQTVAGTVRYLAPEVQRGGRVAPAADVYSAAIVICELFGGSLELDELGQDLPLGLSRLLQQMNSASPAQRPSAVQALVQLRDWAASLRRRTSAAPPDGEAPMTVRELTAITQERTSTTERVAAAALVDSPTIPRLPRPSLTETDVIEPGRPAEDLWGRAKDSPADLVRVADAQLATADDPGVREARARALCELAIAQPARRQELAEQALSDATEALFFRPSPRLHALRAVAYELRGAPRHTVWQERETALVHGYRDYEVLVELLDAEIASGDGAACVGIGLLATALGVGIGNADAGHGPGGRRMKALQLYVAGEPEEAASVLDVAEHDSPPAVALLRALIALACHRHSGGGGWLGRSPGLSRARAFLALALEGDSWVRDLAGIVDDVLRAVVSKARVAMVEPPSIFMDLTAREVASLFWPPLDMDISLRQDH